MTSIVCLFVLQLVAGIHTINWVHRSSRNGELPTPNGGLEQTASLVLDIDKNGVDDFVIAERTLTPSLVWFRRTQTSWVKYVLDNTQLHIEAGGTYWDIDGDGDLDIVMGGDYQSNEVWWWENPYPNFNPSTPWTRRIIKNTGSNTHHDQVFGDFDGDGKGELAFWNQGASTLLIAEIPADPHTASSWNITPIYSYSGNIHEGLAIGDVDNDGKLDIIGGGRWFKHISGTTYAVEVIDDTKRFTRSSAGQLKGGGRLEVVFVPGDEDGRITYYEWNGSSWIGTDLLGFDVIHGHSLQIADIDNDGKLDIFNAEMRLGGGNANAKMRIFFGDGNGNFTLSEVATGFGNHESRLGDLDGDGDLDILDKPYDWDAPRVDVWLQNGSGTLPPYSLDQWQRHAIDQDKPWRAVFVAAGDMDNDGLKDVLTGGWWYQNPGNAFGTWTRNTIGSPLNNMACVYDFDYDGAIDVLGTKGQGADPNAEFVWAKNNGSGSFTILTNVPNGEGDFLQGVAAAHFQPGNPVEVALSWHQSGSGVQMLTVPSDPSTGSWTWRRVSTTSQDEQISATDLENNGSLDLVLGTQWLRNNGVSSWSPFTLNPTSGDPDRNRLADINRDGRIDVVVGFEAISVGENLAWYEQPTTPTGTWTEHIISTTVVGPMSLDVADMDHDGDMDVVVGEHNLNNPATAQLIIFENVNGAGTSWSQHIVYTGDEHHDGAQVADLDNDGDLDIISIGWNNSSVEWYENRAIVLNPPPVPVQLVSFIATRRNPTEVGLEWRTLTETNSFGFSVQKKVGSEQSFSDIPNSFVPGHGTTLEPHSYTFVDGNATQEATYYRLRQVDLDGTVHFSEPIIIGTTDVDSQLVPTEFSLSQNYPNPFNPMTKIRFSIPVGTGHAPSLRVYDMLGREVATLVNENLKPGSYETTFDARLTAGGQASSLASGVYYYRITAGDFVATKKMVLMR
jgi:hypothetical protein